MYGGSLPSFKTTCSSKKHEQLKRIHAVKRRYPPPTQLKCNFLQEIYRDVYWAFRHFQHWLLYEIEDHDFDDFELNAVRYKPDSLEAITKMTKFSKREIQLMYRGFKQGCPTGMVTLHEFQEIYSQFFPQGEPSKYAEFVFNTFDRDRNGSISFEEFVIGLSILSRGSLDDKLEWVFDLYDIKKRGKINRDELYVVVHSIYDLMGKYTQPPVHDRSIEDHTNDIFNKMDEDKNGSITRIEFIDACRNDTEICSSLSLFGTRM